MITRLLLLLVAAVIPAVSVAAVATVTVDSSKMATLASVNVGESVEIARFPTGPNRSGDITFERIDVLAPGAKVIVVDADGERELPRSDRVHLIGHSADGKTRVGLSFNLDLRDVPSGAGIGIDGEFILRAERSGADWSFSAITPDAALPAGVELQYPRNDDSLQAPGDPLGSLDALASSLQPIPSADGPVRIAVIGVDTDASLLSKRFGNNTSSASTWIADLFVQLNVIYQRDLNVRLLQGTTFLRPNSDPYANADTVANQAQLVEFGNYWQANYSAGSNAVSRSFAMLLSGNSAASNQASGIAWLNSYCRTQGTGGSYSTNQVYTRPDISVASSGFIVAHEIGHNFGAFHTHCSSLATGGGPAATGTIDQCFSGEAAQPPGCYSGPQSCPGVGGSGTLMSYCHISGCNRPNQQIFHPSHVNFLLTRIAANTPSCLTTSSVIFTNGFD